MINITIPADDVVFLTKDFVENFAKIPVEKGRGGVYKIYDKEGVLLYVGMSDNMYSRLRNHITKSTVTRGNNGYYEVRCIYVDDGMERDIYETYIINTLKPTLNRDKIYYEKKESVKLPRYNAYIWRINQLRKVRANAIK